MSFSVIPIADRDFSALVAGAPPVVEVVMTGNADFNVKKELDRFLRELHAAATGASIGHVRLDLKKLAFMDSSCLKVLAWWVNSLTQARGQTYRLTFVSDPKMQWQRRSLQALACLGGEMVSIER